MKRKAISKKLRFEVFKRDGFRCQYCGASAPDVILHVDHINPVKNRGCNDILNLITSCFDCNSGKGARTLDDQSVLEKQKAQLQELSERREQLKLMVEWREELKKFDDIQVGQIEKILYEGTDSQLSAYGRSEVVKWIKKYGFNEVVESTEISRRQYFDGEDSLGKAFNYIPRICASRQLSEKNPHLKELYYIRAIVRNSYNYCNDKAAIILLQEAHKLGMPFENMKEIAKSCTNWTAWKATMEEILDIYRYERPEQ